nr:hypothetical protein Iba_chr03aCG6740 [Ipomoea batatas]
MHTIKNRRVHLFQHRTFFQLKPRSSPRIVKKINKFLISGVTIYKAGSEIDASIKHQSAGQGLSSVVQSLKPNPSPPPHRTITKEPESAILPVAVVAVAGDSRVTASDHPDGCDVRGTVEGGRLEVK